MALKLGVAAARQNGAMHCKSPGLIFPQAWSCWNWKCALLSATARALVYLAAMARGGAHGRLAVVLVEIAYVTLTAGFYAGLQQRALGIRSRVLGNLVIVVGVPGLAQAVDWLLHRVSGAAAPGSATMAVCAFALVSALFHLHVMRRGVFLTGDGSHSLKEDFRLMPRLAARFVLKPLVVAPALAERIERALDSEAAA